MAIRNDVIARPLHHPPTFRPLKHTPQGRNPSRLREMPEHSRMPQCYRGGELVIVIDCADLDRSAHFWTDALGYLREESAGKIYQTLVPADGRGCEILLQRVPDQKLAKNR